MSHDTRSPPVIEAAAALGATWLRSQGLAPRVWQTWQPTSLPDLPLDLVSDLRAAYYIAVGDAELHQRELVGVLQTLAAQAIRPVVVKGAALGLAQLRRIEELLAKRDQAAQWYNERLANVELIERPYIAPPTTRTAAFSSRRVTRRRWLKRCGICTTIDLKQRQWVALRARMGRRILIGINRRASSSI